MDVNDFNNVKHSICFYDIKGPIIQGAYHVLQRSQTRKEDRMYMSDKKWSRLAVWTFGISSLLLYFFVADMVNRVSGHEQILSIHNIKACNTSIDVYIKWIPLFTVVMIILKALLGWIIRNKYGMSVIKRIIDSDAYRSILVLGVVFSLFAVVRFCFGHPWNAIAETFFIPCVLVVMMLSVEWLIFMRQEYSAVVRNAEAQAEAKKNNASVLIVLVCAAILTDICLGVVELITHSKLPDSHVDTMDYVAKVASALILGCICFFAGKFLDMYRMQQQTDVYKMKTCIKKLGEKINEE